MDKSNLRGLGAAGLAALLVVGCGGDGGIPAGIPAGSPAGSPEAEIDAAIDEVDLPSQDEVDQQAEAAIDESNADAEFEALKQEIEKDG